MAFEEISRHIARYGLLALFQEAEVAGSHPRRNLEADVEHLAEVGVEKFVGLVMAEGTDILVRSPSGNGVGGGQPGTVDVDDGRVGGTELVDMGEGFGIDLLGEIQADAAVFGEANDFLQPGGAGGFHVDAAVVFREGAADRGIDGKFVAAGMDAQFQGIRQAVGGDGMGNDTEVFIELLPKLCDISHVIDAFVETTGEFRRDSLHGDPLVRDCSEDDEELRRCLRGIRLVHRDFGDEGGFALGGEDVLIDLACFGDGEEVFFRDAADLGLADGEGAVNAGDEDLRGELGMTFHKGFNGRLVRRFADEVGDVDSEEVRDGDEAFHGGEADVIRIDMVGAAPAGCFYGSVRRGASAGGLGADDSVLAVRFIPDRANLSARLRRENTGPKLGGGLVGKTVAHADCELADL